MQLYCLQTALPRRQQRLIHHKTPEDTVKYKIEYLKITKCCKSRTDQDGIASSAPVKCNHEVEAQLGHSTWHQRAVYLLTKNTLYPVQNKQVK